MSVNNPENLPLIQKVIRIQNIFTKELVRDKGRTILLGLRMMMEDGALLKMIKRGWQSLIFKSYSPQLIQLVWSQF